MNCIFCEQECSETYPVECSLCKYEPKYFPNKDRTFSTFSFSVNAQTRLGGYIYIEPDKQNGSFAIYGMYADGNFLSEVSINGDVRDKFKKAIIKLEKLYTFC